MTSNSRNHEPAKPMRAVPFAPGYYVTEDGEVFSAKYPGKAMRKLKPGVHTQGYERYGLVIDGRTRSTFGHHIVLMTWVGPRPSEKHVTRHLDGNPRNNRASNLAWGTQQENIDDKRRHGTLATGERNGRHTHPESVARGEDVPFAKLTEAQVREVFAALASGETGISLARRFGVAKTTISAIKNGKNWAWLKPPGWTPPDVHGAVFGKGAK